MSPGRVVSCEFWCNDGMAFDEWQILWDDRDVVKGRMPTNWSTGVSSWGLSLGFISCIFLFPAYKEMKDSFYHMLPPPMTFHSSVWGPTAMDQIFWNCEPETALLLHRAFWSQQWKVTGTDSTFLPEEEKRGTYRCSLFKGCYKSQRNNKSF